MINTWERKRLLDYGNQNGRKQKYIILFLIIIDIEKLYHKLGKYSAKEL